MFSFLFSGSAAGSVDHPMTPPESVQIVRFNGSVVECSMPDLLKDGIVKETDTYQVIAMVGQVRQGKSTFMNCIVSTLMGANIAPFATSDDMETCTRGIQMVICKSAATGKNYILLDCHGLADATSRTDAKNDPALLLMAYGVSGTIVHNVSALNNATVKELESLTVFLNDFETPDKKPRLTYRVKDYRIKSDVRDALKAMFVRGGDQYDHIKNTIENNVSDITAVSTRLSDVDYEYLEKRDYMGLLANTSNGFKKAIDEIMTHSTIETNYTTFQESLTTLADEINRGGIDLKVLDVIQMHHENTVLKYVNDMRATNAHLWTELDTSPLQVDYLQVEGRRDAIVEMLSKYSHDFAKIDPEIMKKHRTQIQGELDTIVNRADEKVKGHVEEQMKTVQQKVNDYAKEKIQSIYMLESNAVVEAYVDRLKMHFDSLTTDFTIKHMVPHREEFNRHMNNVRSKLSVSNDVAMAVMLLELNEIKAKFSDPDHMIQYINEHSDETTCIYVFMPDESYDTAFVSNYMDYYRQTIKSTIAKYTFKKVHAFHRYDAEHPVTFEEFVPNVSGYDTIDCHHPKVMEYYVESKRPRLTAYMNENQVSTAEFKQLVRANPPIDFVVLSVSEYSPCSKYLVVNVFDNKQYITRDYAMHLINACFGTKYSDEKIWKVLFQQTPYVDVETNVFQFKTDTPDASFLAELLVRHVVESKIAK